MAEKQEISCDLWRKGQEIEPRQGYLARVRCQFYAAGKCEHKAGPLICPTGGLRSALR